MNEFENGFHNENLENNRINNQENNSQQVAIDVTPIEESVTQENTESHRYSYREQGTGGSCGNIRVYFLFLFLYTLFYMQSLIYINQKDFKIGLQSMRISLRRIPLEWFSSLYI